MPHALLEALAVGTPVVATAVGGVPEVVEDGVNGLLVPPRSPEATARAIRRIAHDTGLRTRLAGAAASSVEHLREDVLLARTEELLLGVVEA
jgi:glycosyltransferase involved in cell wall biosynthesis